MFIGVTCSLGSDHIYSPMMNCDPWVMIISRIEGRVHRHGIQLRKSKSPILFGSDLDVCDFIIHRSQDGQPLTAMLPIHCRLHHDKGHGCLLDFMGEIWYNGGFLHPGNDHTPIRLCHGDQFMIGGRLFAIHCTTTSRPQQPPLAVTSTRPAIPDEEAPLTPFSAPSSPSPSSPSSTSSSSPNVAYLHTVYPSPDVTDQPQPPLPGQVIQINLRFDHALGLVKPEDIPM